MTAREQEIRVGAEMDGDALAQAAHVQARSRSRKVAALAVGFFAIVLFGAVMPTNLFDIFGRLSMPLAQWLQILANRFWMLMNAVTGNDAAIAEAVGATATGRSFYESTLMTVVVAALNGAALGMCGSVYQGALRNPLAAPKTLGVMAGGALGSLVYFLFLSGPVSAFLDMPPIIVETAGVFTAGEYAQWLNSLNPVQWFWAMYGKCLVSMLGCVCIVAVVLGIAALMGRGKLSNVALILSGQVFAVSVTAMLLFARYATTQMGSFDLSDSIKEIETYALKGPYRYEDLLIIVLPLLVMMLVVFLMRHRLEAVTLGDDEARSLGVNPTRVRYGMVVLCTLITGWAISFSGHIAFAGFISAHVARKIVGPEMRYLLPASVFTGGILVTALYLFTQIGFGFAPAGSTGMWCSILGSAMFLVLALRGRGKGSGDWR